jgi:hypothetical protein
MNKSILMLMVLAILPISARMIAQDNEVYELRTKLKYAEDFAKLHPDPGHIFMQKHTLNTKWIALANQAKSLGLDNFITKDLFGENIRFSGMRSGGGYGTVKEQESYNSEIYEKKRSELEKQFQDLENLPEQKNLYVLAQANLAKVKEAYDKALKNYFELTKDIS